MGNFLDPGAFALLGLLPVIVLFYILKLKRKEHVIASTFLWRKSIDDLRVNAPFQKLRQNLLLYLQLFFLALAVFAMARPFLKLRGFEGQSVILLFDTSASMLATDVEPTRFEAARRMAIEMVDDMSRGDKMMVITFDAKSATVCSLTTDRSLLRRVIGSLEARQTRTSIREALTIAQAAASAQDNPEIVILSDGGFPDLPANLDVKARVSYIAVGKRSRNLGIVGLEPRRNVDVGNEYEVFCKVQNSTETDWAGVVEFHLNGQLTDAKEIKIPKGDRGSVLFNRPGITDGVVQARLQGEDDLSCDDQAWLVLAPERKTSVLLVTSGGNYFLEKVLDKDPTLRVERASPSTFESIPAGEFEKWDVFVFDGVSPERLPAQGRFLFFHAIPKLQGFEDGGELPSPTVLDWSRAHPANRFVNFANLEVMKARLVKYPKWAEQILEAEGGPLILSLDRELTRALITTFDVFESDWPLRLSFPIFVANSMQWLGGRDRMSAGEQVRTGEVYSFMPDRGAREVTITLPGGEPVTLPVGSERRLLFGETRRIGLYAVSIAERPDRFFAANLLDPNESATLPKESFRVGDQLVKGTKEPVEANREVWHWLAILALTLLMAEWYIFNRRVFL